MEGRYSPTFGEMTVSPIIKKVPPSLLHFKNEINKKSAEYIYIKFFQSLGTDSGFNTDITFNP